MQLALVGMALQANLSCISHLRLIALLCQIILYSSFLIKFYAIFFS